MPDELTAAPEATVGALDAAADSSTVTRWDPSNYFWLSVLLPGAGQLAQRRFGAAALQAATVGTARIRLDERPERKLLVRPRRIPTRSRS